jgi:YesN/AraC family two-component response regulator
VNTAQSGYQGLAAIQANGPYAVIISDMRMPEMNGAEFFAHVRQKAPDSVRILLTGHADLDAAIDAVNRGNIFRFLTKPCKKQNLVEAIQSGLDQYSTAASPREIVKKAHTLENIKSDWDTMDDCLFEEFEGPARLPGPAQALACLQTRIGTDRQCYVLMVKLTMLHTVEERYGEMAALTSWKKIVAPRSSSGKYPISSMMRPLGAR